MSSHDDFWKKYYNDGQREKMPWEDFKKYYLNEKNDNE